MWDLVTSANPAPAENPEEGGGRKCQPKNKGANEGAAAKGEREALAEISCSPVSKITEKAEDLEESKGSHGESPEKLDPLLTDMCLEDEAVLFQNSTFGVSMSLGKENI